VGERGGVGERKGEEGGRNDPNIIYVHMNKRKKNLKKQK
jgi:hypothetical protein